MVAGAVRRAASRVAPHAAPAATSRRSGPAFRLGAVAAARRRARHHGHRRLPGQGHDRAAADEDGRRRGALRRPRSRRRSRSSRSARSTAREEVYKLEVPSLLSFLGTGNLDGEVGASTPAGGVRAEVRPGRLRAQHPGHLLDVPPDDHARRPRHGGRRSPCSGSPAGAAPRRVGLLLRAAIVLPLLPLAANSFGWIFTEMGRQPWVVFGADADVRGRLARPSARPRWRRR